MGGKKLTCWYKSLLSQIWIGLTFAALPWQYQGLKEQSLTNKEGTTADSIQRTTKNEALCVVRIRLLCLFGYFFWPPLKALIVCCMLALEPQGSNTFIVRCDFGSEGKCLNNFLSPVILLQEDYGALDCGWRLIFQQTEIPTSLCSWVTLDSRHQWHL